LGERQKERKKACACVCLFVSFFFELGKQKLGLGGGCIYVAGENQPYEMVLNYLYQQQLSF
jgi:hypothetical protein